VDRRDEVGREDQGPVGVQPPDRGVVARGRADEQVGMVRQFQAAQDLRQLAGRELAGSARAVTELGESSRGGGHSGRIYRRRGRYL